MLKCEVCGSLDRVVLFDVAGTGIWKVEVCNQCFENGAFKRWLEFQFEEALNAHPALEPLGDGRWQRK